MNLTYLRSFYATVKCNSISKAAKELHVTQPGLSMQLQNLENEIGETLLNRSNKGVQLTEAGKVVFEFADTMLSLQDNLEKSLLSLKNKKSKLFISCCKSLGENVLPCSIYTFKEIHINTDISMEVDNSSNVIKKLLNHETNIGIVQGSRNIPDTIEIIPMMQDKLILVGGKDSSISSITLDELSSLPLILRENGSSTRELLNNALKANLMTTDNLNVLISLSSPEAIKSSISSGRGFSILPELALTHELRNNTLKKIHLQNFDISFDYYIAYRKNYTFTEKEEKFVKFMTSSKRCFCY